MADRKAKTVFASALKWLAFRSYPTAKLHATLRFHAELRRRRRLGPEVIVYQMGKTGSMSIRDSLEALGRFAYVHHIHTLTGDGWKGRERKYRQDFARDRRVAQRTISSEYLHRQVARGRGQSQKWTVITGTREPVSMNISAFFQTLKHEFPATYYRMASGRADKRRLIEELNDIFLNEYAHHDLPLDWFEHELKPVFGVDVYAREFPVYRGYDIYESDIARVLLIRQENLSQSVSTAIREFLSIEGFRLQSSNVAYYKDYYPVYRRFLSEAVLPDSSIERMYGSRYARHFYSAEELRGLRQRWASRRRASRAVSG